MSRGEKYLDEVTETLPDTTAGRHNITCPVNTSSHSTLRVSCPDVRDLSG